MDVAVSMVEARRRQQEALGYMAPSASPVVNATASA